MTLVLTPEAEIIRDTARQFFDKRSPVSALRALRDRRDPDGFSRPLWHDMAELGWAGFLVPEAYGGSEFGIGGLALALEAAGRTLAPTPLFSTALLGASALVLGGSDEQKREFLPGLVSGQHLFAIALEDAAHHAPQPMTTRAERTANGWRLNGTKPFVMDGGVADIFIVAARVDGKALEGNAVGLFLVPRIAAGVSTTPHLMVDNRNAATIRLTDVALGEDAELREPHRGVDLLDRLLQRAYVGLAAESLGLAAEAFDRTLQFLKERRQFGVAIGSFQALKHRAALMFCELELLRSAVRGAVEAQELGAENASALASVAKAKACDALWLISNECIQMHGGIGTTDEHEIGFFLKRARVIQRAFGDASFHRSRYAAQVGY